MLEGEKRNPIYDSPVSDIMENNFLCKNVVSTVGKKPSVRIWLNDTCFKALWDTGSQVSVISKRLADALFKENPAWKLLSVED